MFYVLEHVSTYLNMYVISREQKQTKKMRNLCQQRRMEKAETGVSLFYPPFSLKPACASDTMQAVEVMSIVSRQQVSPVVVSLRSSHILVSRKQSPNILYHSPSNGTKAFNSPNHSLCTSLYM